MNKIDIGIDKSEIVFLFEILRKKEKITDFEYKKALEKISTYDIKKYVTPHMGVQK